MWKMLSQTINQGLTGQIMGSSSGKKVQIESSLGVFKVSHPLIILLLRLMPTKTILWLESTFHGSIIVNRIIRI